MDEVLHSYDQRLYKLMLYTCMYSPIDLNKGYEENLFKIIETLKENPTGLVTSLTMRTYYFLSEALTFPANNKYVRNGYYEDDFDLLKTLNIVDTRTNMINPIWKDVIETVIKMPITKSFAYMISTVKGIVDTYGIVDLAFIDKILSSFVTNKTFNARYIISNSNFLYAYCEIDGDKVYHKVLSDTERKQILEFRKKNLTPDFNMKTFKIAEYMSFASSYRLEEVRPYLPSEWFDVIFKDKRFSLELYTVKHLHDEGIINSNVANKLEEIHKYYPKWGLNGYSIQEYYNYQNSKKVA